MPMPDAPLPLRQRASRFTLPLLFFMLFFGIGSAQPFLVEHATALARQCGPFTRWVFLRGGLHLAPLLLAVLYVVFAPCRLLGVWFIHRFGRTWTLRAGTLLYFGLSVAMYLGRTPWAILAGCVSVGIGAGLVWTAGASQTLDQAGRGGYGSSSGLLLAAGKFGYLLGTLMLGELTARWAVSKLAISPFGPSLVIGLVAVALAAWSQSPPAAANAPSWGAIRKVFRRPKFKVVSGLLLFSFFSYGLFLAHLMPVFQERFRGAGTPYLAPSYLVSAMVISWVAGWLSDRVGRWPVLLGGYACGGVAMLLLVGFSPTFPVWRLFLAMVALAAPFAAVPVCVMAWTGDVADPRDRPLVYAVTFFWRDLGVVAAALAAVWLGRPDNLTPGFVALAVLFLAPAGVALAAMAVRRARARAGAADPE